MIKENLNLEKWEDSINRFSEVNRNRETQIEVFCFYEHSMRAYWLEEGMSLRGIGVDMKCSSAPRIHIMLEAKDAHHGHLTHVVSNAKTITMEQSYEGHFDSLQIEDVEGAKTVLRFETLAAAA